MKTEIVKTEQVNEIDWSKPMLLKCGELVVFSLGIDSEMTFKGVVLISGNGFKLGHASNGWPKNQFTPITEPITIKFIP